MTQMRNFSVTVGERTARERAWDVMTDERTFDTGTLMEAADISQANAIKLLEHLRNQGLVEKVGRTGPHGKEGSYGRYRLVRVPDEVPEAVSKKVLAWRKQVWNALRIQRLTTVPKIMSSFYEVDVAEDTVYRYLRKLEQAGYVARAGRSGKDGQVMSHLRWRLVKDTGPSAPGRQQLEQEIQEQQQEEEAG